MRNSLVEKTYKWDLKSSPSALWPIISDTARLNEALGLPLYRISETFDSNSLRRRYGEMDEDGARIRWEEPLFEWVENGWWRWRRFYNEGPLRETGGILMLMPGERGGTRVHYSLSIDPNGALGRMLVASGHLKLAARSFEKLSKQVDEFCQKPHGDFFSNFAFKNSGKQQPSFPEARGEEAQLLTQFAHWLKVAPLADRLDLRSPRLARCLGVTRSEALRACLLATRSGDLVMRYRAICPSCRASANEVATLGEIPALLACRRCGAGYHRDLTESVEVLFSVADADDRLGTHCGSGPTTAPHVPIQQNVGAVERRDLDFKLPPGAYAVRAMDGPVSDFFELTAATGVHVSLTDQGISVRPGGETCVIENHCNREFAVTVERRDWHQDALPATELLAEQCFHDLMPEHKLADGDTASVGFGVFLGVADLAGELSAQRDGAVVDRGENYFGLVFASVGDAIASAEKLRLTHKEARFALDCGVLSIGTQAGQMRYLGTAPDSARSLALAGHRGVIRVSPKLKDLLQQLELPIPASGPAEAAI